MKGFQDYIIAVQNDSIITNSYIKLAVKRHVSDLEKSKTDKFPYYFDELAAEKAISFYRLINHTKGEWANTPIILKPWQEFIIGSIFGWKRKNNETRRFRIAYIEVARKNGKSTMFAGLGLIGLLVDGEAEAEVYSAATKRDQAKIIWDQARNMLKSSPSLKKHVSLYQYSIVANSTRSKFVPLSTDADTTDGLNISMGLIDEYHAHKNDEMYNVIRSAMGSRRQPLLAIITTAGFNTASSCKREHDYVIQLLEGNQDNDEYFGVIYTLDKKDNWQDEKNWIKSNPNLGVSVSLEDMRAQYNEAKSRPSKINEFKTKKLNIWTNVYTRWILPDKWSANVKPIQLKDFEGRPCYAGIDLSTTTDISGFCLCFPPIMAGEKPALFWKFFIPLEGLRERSLKEDVPYQDWIDKGFVIPTPGDVIDYDYIESELLKAAEKFEIVEVPHDPYNATQFVNSLSEQGLECVQFNQSIKAISPAAKNFERMVLRNEIEVEINPVMDYMIGSAEIYTDANQNIKVIKPDRKTSNKRIDGVIMAIMALYRAVINQEDRVSVYAERGLITI